MVNSGQLTSLTLRGYKSIADSTLALGRLNVLIGANGVGKSNFISFFRFMHQVALGNLQNTIGLMGGPDAVLYFGRKKTEALYAELLFEKQGYRFTLQPTQDNRMMFTQEEFLGTEFKVDKPLAGHFETAACTQQERFCVRDAMQRWTVYHFHDTSTSALVKQIHNVRDNEYLREDARNLAAFLYRLKQYHTENYQRIVKVIQLIAPFFGDFHLRPTVGNAERIQLEWTEKGMDEPFTASALSDGTLRFICLATALLQPEELMPQTVLIDEPELGLHPFAIRVLAGLIKSAAQSHQLIISTQSVELVNEFDVENLIIVEKNGGESTFTRPDEDSVKEWLTEYSLGEIWKKNLLGGRPKI